MMEITLNGKLFLAPIDPNCKHTLDVATGQNSTRPPSIRLLTMMYPGTGLWAIEFGAWIFLMGLHL
jgi:hypothetical protein